MVEVQVSTPSGTIQVALPPDSQLEMVDTWNNRRLLMVLLRLLHGADGKPLMTFAAIAQAFEYKDRRNVNNFWREFEQSGQDVLQYLARQYKIDERIRQAIVQVFLEDLWATVAAVTTQVRHRLELGAKDLSERTVQYVLGDLLKVQAQLKRRLAQGQAHVRDAFLIEELFALARAPAGSAAAIAWRQEKVQHLQAATTAVAVRAAPAAAPAPAVPDAGLEQELRKQDAAVADWVPGYVWMLLLYWHGLPLSTLGKWFGVHKSTIWRRLMKFSAVGMLVLGLGAGVCSGVIGVDEKWIKVAGQWHYLFTAVDLETGLPLHFEIYKSRSTYYCRLFLTKLGQLGYQPRLIVSDGWRGYAWAIKKVFPKAQHQLCIFHVMRALMAWLKQHIRSEDQVAEYGKQVKRIFQTTDKRTAERRYRKLKRRRRLKVLLRLLRRKWPRIIPALGSTWIPTTNNGTERFNRAFERFYRARQAFQARASASDQVWLFMLGYLIEQPVGSGCCPLEQVHPRIRTWALYQLWNNPDFSKMRLDQCRRRRKAA